MRLSQASFHTVEKNGWKLLQTHLHMSTQLTHVHVSLPEKKQGVIITLVVLYPSPASGIMCILFADKQKRLISLVFLREYEIDLCMDPGLIKGLATTYHQIKEILRELVSK